MNREAIVYFVLCLVTVCLFGFESYHTPVEDTFKSFSVTEAKELEVTVSANIYLITSESKGLKIEGNQFLLDQLAIDHEGPKMAIRIKNTLNPWKLIRLAYVADQPLNIYINAPDAKDIYLSNRNNFNISNYYENEEATMITLKSPKLFATESSECCRETKISNS